MIEHIRLSSVDLLGLIPARVTIINNKKTLIRESLLFKIVFLNEYLNFYETKNHPKGWLICIYCFKREYYSIISITDPAPTVWPPSRTENLEPFSIAIGAINSTLISVLSPGITISTPCFKVIDPVTSVVRK